MAHLTIAIDGPAGAGKSTIAKILAKHYNIIYVDTGAMYRAVAHYMTLVGIPLSLEKEVVKAMSNVQIDLKFQKGRQKVFLNGEDVTTAIRQQKVGVNASKISIYLPVRKKMVELQQAMAVKNSLIMDGRDIGTHVLTEATLKVYLWADPLIRAKRRFDQLVRKGEEPILEAIVKEINERDHRDMNREHAPLIQAKDAVRLDTSHLSIEETVLEITGLVNPDYSRDCH